VRNTRLDSKLEDPIPWLIGLLRLATVVVVVGGSDGLRWKVVVLGVRNPNPTHTQISMPDPVLPLFMVVSACCGGHRNRSS